MKKILSTLLIITFAGISTAAEVNMPGEPTYGTPSSVNSSTSSCYKKSTTSTPNPANYSNVSIPQPVSTSTSSGGGAKATLDSLAMSALKAAERHDDAGMNAYIQKMMKAGAEGFSSPKIISKRTPHCPPIRIEVNGRKMSGSTCGMFGYLYKGKQYDVGYCK